MNFLYYLGLPHYSKILNTFNNVAIIWNNKYIYVLNVRDLHLKLELELHRRLDLIGLSHDLCLHLKMYENELRIFEKLINEYNFTVSRR